MTPERWRRITEVFHAALARDPAVRGALLDEACAGDSALRGEVDALLAAHGDAGNFGEPAPATLSVERAARLGRGAALGPYRIEGLVGAGGMGEVYRARDERLARDVAVKVLASHVASEPQWKQRFEREARALAALSHPHICPVFDVGRQEGIDYLVMEFLEGETLADRLAKGALPLPQALRHAVEVADALDKAHRQGVVHRDLKPGNVMLTRSGAKLLDFGLARLRAAHFVDTAGSAPPVPSANLTGEGRILGTLQYMAPEQIEGREADARTDIFAFGATLYEMATGRKAFEGKSQASIAAAILEHQPVPPSALQPAAPAALDRLLAVCLAKDPEERWQSAGDLRRELAWIGEAGAQASAPARAGVRRERRGRTAWAVAAVAGAIAIGMGAAAFRRQQAIPRAVRFSVPPPPNADFTVYGTSGSPQLAVSPDGRYVTFVASRPAARSQLWLRALDSLSAVALPGTEDASFPFWSPDSQSIGFFAEGKLKRIQASGGGIQTLCDAPNNRGGAWGGGGFIVFAPNPTDPIHRVPASGGVPTPITALDPSGQQTSHRFPSLLGDGGGLLYLAREGGQRAIYARSGEATEAKRVLSAGLSAAYVPPGYLFFVRERSLMAQPFDTSALQLKGEPTAIAAPVGGSTVYHAAFSASANGVLAYASRIALTGQLTWFDRGGTPRGTVGPPADYMGFQVSPDQKQVALTLTDEAQDSTDLWLLDLARDVPLRVTHDPRTDASACWSPDGRRLAFRSDRLGTDDLYVRAAGSAGEDEPLFLSAALQKFPTDWSADGGFITYHSPGATGWDLWTFSVTRRSNTPFLRTQFNEIHGRLSPDGRWMAYASDESGVMEVYVRSFPAAQDPVRVSKGGGSEPHWRADGGELFFMAPDRSLMAVRVEAGSRFRPGPPTLLFQTRVPGFSTPYRNNTYAASADGQRFLVNTTVSDGPSTAINVILDWPALLRK
jgi:Tol biopolymer transport system component